MEIIDLTKPHIFFYIQDTVIKRYSNLNTNFFIKYLYASQVINNNSEDYRL
ncbi:hypothetical protein KL86DYS1_31530 [uncultured Dysgonomonas sp.]|uniref:Uncharacterized protein n=1 Tax=uncultured Dysgonomonas sp. TaxID=206096 RepID=A0A212K5I0_9BACT|nr:hypothetical protein KL86DYS1_31530 [uncultured Dysgonomonas sp.]